MRYLILIVISALVVSYAHDERFKPADQSGQPTKAITIKAEQRGFPNISLANGYDLVTTEQTNRGPAVALVSGDFDSDGTDDLVTGDQTGRLNMFRGAAQTGNLLRTKGAVQNEVQPFHPATSAAALGFVPSYLAAGDFNSDGHADILTAAKNADALTLLGGDGRGQFGAPYQIKLRGSITALATGEIGRADRLTDIAVAVSHPKGTALYVFEFPEGALKAKPEVFNFDAPVTDIAIGNLDDDGYADIAVASGNELTIIHGRGQAYPWDMIPAVGIKRPAPVVARRQMPFEIAELTAGKFGGRRGDSLALLGGDGNVYRLEPIGSPAPADKPKADKLSALAKARSTKSPFIPAGTEPRDALAVAATSPDTEWAAKSTGVPAQGVGSGDGDPFARPGKRRRRERPENVENAGSGEADNFSAAGTQSAPPNDAAAKKAFIKSISARASTLARWELRTLVSDPRLLGAAFSSAPQKMIRARVSGGGTDDLLLMDQNTSLLHIVTGNPNLQSAGPNPQSLVVSLEVEGGPAAVLPIRLNLDALQDLVVLRKGSAAPSVVMTAPANTFVVTSTEGGEGSCGEGSTNCTLRSAIIAANSSGGTDLITFNIPGGGTHTIASVSQLPAIQWPVTIDGTTQPGYNGSPLIEITGVNIPADTAADGLKVQTSGTAIIGLAVNSFPSTLNPDGSHYGGNGIEIDNIVSGPDNNNNLIQGCYLGTDATGTIDKGNHSTGLLIFASHSNQIGGTAPGEGNVISGNGSPEKLGSGISVTAGNENVFEGNIIGLNASGTAKLGNARSGVFFSGKDNLFGGDAAGAGNTVSGNGAPTEYRGETGCLGLGMELVVLYDQNTNELLSLNNTLKGNRFGTNPAGTAALGNCEMGLLTSPVTQTTIGSITPNGRNVFSGNEVDAVYCSDQIYYNPDFTGGGCKIVGNNIGTDVTGQAAVPNTVLNFDFSLYGYGTILIEDNTGMSVVGSPGGTTPNGACTGFCNLISGNNPQASFIDTVARYGKGTTGYYNNFVGTNSNGNQALPNGGDGLRGILNGTFYVGGVGTDQGNNPVSLGNLVSGNESGVGVVIAYNPNFDRSASPKAYVQGNLIGTDTTGLVAIPNLFGISARTTRNDELFIGGTSPLERNIISGNTIHGIGFDDDVFYPQNGVKTRMQNNLIGVNRSLQPLGNGGSGIWMRYRYNVFPEIPRVRQHDVVIGGSSPAEGNVIAHNGGDGITFLNSYVGNIYYHPHGHVIRNNSIHDNSGLGIDLYTHYTPRPGGPSEDIGRGVTPNDCNDTDEGPNALQNFPELFAPVTNQDGTVTVTGVLKTAPSKSYTIDLYSNSTPDPTGHGEGETPIATTTVQTNPNGFASFQFNLQGVNTAAISATATDPDGNTSEFSCNAGQSCSDSPSLNFKSVKEYLANSTEASACASSIIVNVTGDESDEIANDGVCDINTTNDGLQCTLRAALEVTQDPNYVGPRTINFDIPGGGVQTITPASAFPVITRTINLDGSSQPGYNVAPLIEVNGVSVTGDGLVFAAGSDGSTLRALTINRFSGAGVVFQSNENSLEDCYIGLFGDGETHDSNGRQQIGVKVTGKNNRIGGGTNKNYLSANFKYQVLITGSNATDNKVIGNGIGLTGTNQILAGPYIGVGIQLGASNNLIGGDTNAARNLIAGQEFNVLIRDGATSNTVSRNTISDSAAFGVAIIHASNNTIGGPFNGNTFGDKANTFIKNDVGIFIGDDVDVASDPGQGSGDTEGNKIQGNGIGIATSPNLGNRIGVVISATSGENTIGGENIVGEELNGNVISDNREEGILLDFKATSNTIRGNIIGVDPDADSARPNQTGIEVRGKKNTIRGNLISGNSGDGIYFFPLGLSDPTKIPEENIVISNKIGTNRAGTAAVKNGGNGVYLAGRLNKIGEESSGGNLISGNGGNGIEIDDKGTENLVSQNLLGTTTAGDGPLGNKEYGVFIRGSVNTVRSNQISGNDGGVAIAKKLGSTFPAGNFVQRNFIGTNRDGTGAIGNQNAGVLIANGGNDNTIGGLGADDGNLISGNGKMGVAIIGGIEFGLGPSSNKIQGNLIGTNWAGTAAVPNGGSGILVSDASSNLIGGFGADIPAARNVISGNAKSGILIGGTGATQNRVSGNYIGTSANGSSALGNQLGGVYLWKGAHHNIIGGTEPNAGNIIKFNVGHGVFQRADAGQGNAIDPNSISSNTQLGIELDGSGTIYPDDGEEPTTLGGDGPTANDPGDADTGPNNLQNFPEFASAVINTNGDLVIQYKVDSAPGNSNYGADGIFIEFFKADEGLEGQTFIGSTHYTTADYNAGTDTLVLNNASALGIVGGDKLVATATDASGNTSEFTSVNVGVVAAQTQTIFVVNSTNEPGDGVCNAAECTLREAINAANASPGAETISFNIPAQTDAGCNSSTGVCTIKPTSQLPTIVESVTIDGYTQPSAEANTNATGALNAVLKIELSGQSAPSSTIGLNITSANTTVRGLVINRFVGTNGRGIRFTGAGANGGSVAGNYIGTDVTGTTALSNATSVALVSGANNNHVGTDGDGTGDAAERNLISGVMQGGNPLISDSLFTGVGILIQDPGTTGNVVAGNLIGTNAAGDAALRFFNDILIQDSSTNNRVGTNADGVSDDAERNVTTSIVIRSFGTNGNVVAGNYLGTTADGASSLGGGGVSITHAAANNLIGTNADGVNDLAERNIMGGVEISGEGADGNVVAGNYIGTNAAGTAPLGSFHAAVYIIAYAGDDHPSGPPRNNRIGGTTPGEGNLIAFSERDGILMVGGFGNSILSNSIHSNGTGTGDIGIDLGDDGVITPNDPGDADTGVNNLQNFPEFVSAVVNASGELVIQYKVDSAPANSDYGASGLRVEFFEADSSTSLEGQFFIGSDSYTQADYNAGAPGTKTLNLGSAAALGVVSGNTLVATATDADGNTSEFTSTNVGVVAGPTAATATIAGRVLTADGMPLAGVTITISGTQSRKSITDEEGRYQFSEVESTGFYSVAPARSNYGFSPANKSFSILGNVTEADFTAMPQTAPVSNPLDTAEFFVRQHYLDFLNREPDESGFNFWSDQILGCRNDVGCAERRRINVSAAYFLSIEFQQTGGLVDRLYRVSYGVRPKFAEFMPDIRAVGRDVVVGRQGWQAKLEANKKEFAEAFINRAAFIADYGHLDHSKFVDTLIAHTKVSFTSVERDALVSGLANGTLTRAAALMNIAEHPRFVNAKFNEAFVMMQYFGYLRRDPDESGFQYWLAKLNQFNGNFEQAEMVRAFLVSEEYRARFSR